MDLVLRCFLSEEVVLIVRYRPGPHGIEGVGALLHMVRLGAKFETGLGPVPVPGHLLRQRDIRPVIAERGQPHGTGLGICRWVSV